MLASDRLPCLTIGLPCLILFGRVPARTLTRQKAPAVVHLKAYCKELVLQNVLLLVLLIRGDQKLLLFLHHMKTKKKKGEEEGHPTGSIRLYSSS